MVSVPTENHLIIIWEKAREREKTLLKEVGKRFKIVSTREVIWSKTHFAQNLSRFYGLKLPPGSGKEEHCGNGPFLCVILEDTAPQYKTHQTSKGPQMVNTAMFTLKEELRRMTGGGHRVHATNDPDEFIHDITLLFGPGYMNSGKTMRPYKSDVVGAGGWEGLREIFAVLNATTQYVVMRNFETLPEDTDENHSDIDLLVTSPEEVGLILNAQKVFSEEYRVHYKTRLKNGAEVFFDLRYIGDGYYDAKWQREMLNKRILNKRSIYTPDQHNHLFSLLYHALIHKDVFNEDYKNRLSKLAKKNGLALPISSPEQQYMTFLRDFLDRHKYKITVPDDRSVLFQPKRAQLLRRQLRLRRLTAPIMWFKRMKHR